MSKYFIQGDTLTGIADAIREKTGNTESLTVGQMVAAIAGIEAGGGAISNSGTLSLDEPFELGTDAGAWYSVEHGLGVVPDLFIMWNTSLVGTTNINIAMYFNVDTGAKTACYLLGSTSKAELSNVVSYLFDAKKVMTTSDVKIMGNANFSGATIASTVAYSWLAAKYT